MPGNIGWQGLVIILIVLLVIFGPKRLPEMGRSLGRGMREFKDSITGKDDDDQPREIPPVAEDENVPAEDENVPGSPPRERDKVS
jgi:sec-independent protein translocase protein TatA